MKKANNSKELKNQSLPLFEYASRFEDFSTFEDFDHYFTYCLQTSGIKMHIIAGWMNLSDTALSIRLNQIDPEQPRFNVKHVALYVGRSGDKRPSQYLRWQADQAQMASQDILKERIVRLLPHLNDLRAICDLLEGKK